jgi:hypothetical protein
MVVGDRPATSASRSARKAHASPVPIAASSTRAKIRKMASDREKRREGGGGGGGGGGRSMPEVLSLGVAHEGTRPYAGCVSTREELEDLSSKELHDRAVRLAEHRLDVAFLWRLLKSIPVAEAAAGDLPEAQADVGVGDLVPLIHDFVHSDEGKLADALRPVYLDYLEKHEK